MKIKQSEAEVLKAVLAFLKHCEGIYWRNNTTGVWDGTKKVFRKNPGMLRGVSDCLGVLPDGRFFACEVKASKGRVTDEQMDFLDKVNRFGGVGFVARHVDDVINFFNALED